MRHNGWMRKRSWPRLVILGGIGLALMLWGGYAYVTRPSALRARLVDLLERFDLRVSRIGAISFSLTAGLEVSDLEVVAAEGRPRASETQVFDPPPLLRVPRARVGVNPWALSVGEFRPRAVELEAPTIALLWPSADASALWESREAGRLTALGDLPASLPRLKITRADVEIFSVEDDRVRLQRRWVVDGSGMPIAGVRSEPREYVLQLDQVAGPASAKRSQGLPLARLRWQAGKIIAELGWVDLELVRSLAGAKWARSMQRLHLSGQARVKQVVLDSAGLASAQIDGERLSCTIPIESDEETPNHEHYARLTETNLGLEFVRGEPPAANEPEQLRGQARLRLEGRLNESLATLDLQVDDLAYAPHPAADGGEQAATTALDGLGFGPYRAELHVAGLTLPTLSDNPRFVTSERLPQALRSWIRKYDAEGLVNLEVALEGDGWTTGGARPDGAPETAVRYRGELKALDGSCCYSRFPYRIDDVHGLVRFSNDGILFDGLCGRHGAGRIRVDGRLVDSTSQTGFELCFRGCNVASDADLYAALPSEYQAAWRDAAPIGLWDVQVGLHREHGSERQGSQPTRTSVAARLLSGSLSLQDGSRLENAEGSVHIEGRQIELVDVRGYMRGSPLSVSGTITLAGADQRPEHNLHIEAADAALRRTAEVRTGAEEVVGKIEFEGVGDVWGQLRSGAAAQEQYAVRVKDGVLIGFGPGAYWDQVTGWISVRDGQQRIHSLTALRADGRLEVSGTLPRQLGLDRPIVLDLRADDADLDRLLRQLVPGRWSSIREALGLAGRGTLVAHFYPQSSEEAPAQQAADIRLAAECMRPTPLPLDLRDVEADLTLRAAGFDLHQCLARYGVEGRIAVSGHGGWAEGDVWSDMRAEGQELDLDSELVEALPGPVASLLKRMSPRGRMNLALDQVLLTGLEKRAWNVTGKIRLEDAKLNIGIPLTEFDGQLNGSCDIDPEGEAKLEADFAIDQGQLSSRPIERWEGHLRQEPGTRQLHIEDVRGQLCDGAVVGFAAIDFETSSYELSFTLHDVSLAEFRQRDTDPSRGPSPGRLDGHIFLRGETEDLSQRSGGGELRIRGTSLLSSPVTASVMQASAQRQRPIGDDVERAELRFVWEGPELKFSRVDIHSRDLRLVGIGRWDMRSDAISMTLLGATPEDAPRLFPLTDLLESAGQELLQYRVEGTAAQPRVTVEPLHNLTQPLRKLLRGE